MGGMNWAALVADLLAVGWTQARIAKEVGLSQPTVSALARGKQKTITYEAGAKLLEARARALAAPEAA